MSELPDLSEPTNGRGDAAERRYLIGMFSELVEMLGAILPGDTEILFHDLAKVPESIVAIAGSLTGRSVGGSASDIRVERFTDGSGDWRRYEATLPDGRWIQCGALTVRDSSGSPVGALCINSDLSAWDDLERIATALLGRRPQSGADRGDPGSRAAATSRPTERANATSKAAGESTYPKDVESFVGVIVDREIAAVDVPVDLMRKAHKIEVVRGLRSRGVFQMKSAVEQVAGALQVTRFTIYNYLNEINDDDAEASSHDDRHHE